MNRAPQTPRARAGFTLVEMLIALTMFGVVMAMTMGMMTESLRSHYVSEHMNDLSTDKRLTTTRLVVDARQANTFLLYEDFTRARRDKADDRLSEGMSGDLLVLVYFADTAQPWQTRPVERIIGYYLWPREDGAGSELRRFEETFTPAATAELEVLLPKESEVSSHRLVQPFVTGEISGRFFHNVRDRSLLVQGTVRHGNNSLWIRDAYSFVLSPRG